MSIKLTSRVYEKEIEASSQRVLLVLCDFASDDGTHCYPSIDYVAWKLGVNRKTVMRAVSAMEARGVLEVDRQHRHNNRYTIYLDRLPDKPPFRTAASQNGTPTVASQNGTREQNVTQAGQNGTQDRTKGDPIASPQMGHQPSGEPPETTTSTNHQVTPLRERFDRWYRVYPRKRKPQDAWRAWQKINPDEEMTQHMILAVDKQKQSREWKKDGGQFIPYPATWLHAGSWDDQTEVEIGEPAHFTERFAGRVDPVNASAIPVKGKPRLIL